MAIHDLNYHHLLYFWTIAREGSISRACQRLGLAQPTLSKQLQQLERAMGELLFDRVGRKLILTKFGQMVFRYADEIFSLGRELQEVVEGRPENRPQRLVVGIQDVLPKLIVHHLLKPAFGIPDPIHIICQEGKHVDLLGQLAVHRLDLVLSDAPVAPGMNVRAYNHLLGECGITFFGSADLVQKYQKSFPDSLHGAPVLLPGSNSAIRRDLDQWLSNHEIVPQIIGEFEDSALMKVFGQDAIGMFPAPDVIEPEICRQFGVQVVGRTDEVRERYYAISVERRLKHPAVVAIFEAAREKLFSD